MKAEPKKSEGKKSIKGIKVTHNSRLLVVIIILIILLISVIYLLMQRPPESQGGCTKDTDCIPAGCCHPDSCTAFGAPDCSKVLCTMECSGPLDCGVGRCGCIDGECMVIPNK